MPLEPSTLFPANKHRHFGWSGKAADGVLHFLHRSSASHGVIDGATIYYAKSVDGAYSCTPDIEIIPSLSGFDQRGISATILEDGRIFVLYGATPVVSGPGALLKTGWIDNGIWVPGSVIYTSNYDETCLSYGRIKRLPNGKLIATPYYQINATTYRVAVWQFDKYGTNAQELSPIYQGSQGYNETEMIPVDHKTAFAVCRGSGIQLFKSSDGLQSWSYIGELPSTDSMSVSPTIDRFNYNGDPYLMIGYCDRTLNRMVFRVAKTADAMISASAFDKTLAFGADYVNASGYQSLPVLPDGSLDVAGGGFCSVFKEFDAPNTNTEVRVVPFNPISLLAPAAPSPRITISDFSLTGSITAGSHVYSSSGRHGFYEDRGKTIFLSGRIVLSGPIDPNTDGILEITSPSIPLSLNSPTARCMVGFIGSSGVTVTKELNGFVLENSRKIRLQDGQNFSATLTKANIAPGAQIYFQTEYWKA